MATKSLKQAEVSFVPDPFLNAAAIVLEVVEDVSRKKYQPVKSISSSRESLRPPETTQSMPQIPRFSLPVCSLGTVQETGSTSSSGTTTSHEKNNSQTSQDSGVSSPVRCFSDLEVGVLQDERMTAKTKASVDLINTLYRLHLKQEEVLEEECKTYRKALQEQASYLTGYDVLEKRIKMMKDINLHMKKIIEEAPQLKQKLLNPIYHDVWNVHISHHRDIAEFFNLAHSMLTEIEENSQSIKWNGRRNLKENLNLDSYLIAADRTVMELHKNLESLIEFRSALKGLEEAKLVSL